MTQEQRNLLPLQYQLILEQLESSARSFGNCLEKGGNKMQVLIAILQLLPAVIAAIKAIEAAFPQSGIGPEKKGMLIAIMTEAYSGITAMLPAIEAMINGVVAFSNKVGEFKKGQ